MPAGFVTGALTDVVNSGKLLGVAFSPLVSLAVAVILYDAVRPSPASRCMPVHSAQTMKMLTATSTMAHRG